MEVDDRALEETESEDAVRAAFKTALNGADDGSVLSRAGLVDEVDVSLHGLL